MPRLRLDAPSRPAPSGLTGPARVAPLVVYGAASVVSIGVALALGRSPIETDAWLPLPPLAGHVLGLCAGSALALATIRATRQLVRRWSWARDLHARLRPTVEHAGEGTILALGLASAVGEELFFRGILTTTFGVVLSSLAFGLLHQVEGRARWVWAIWATVMGVLFAALFLATGSLLGPILAHAAINVANLRFLRDTAVEPPKPRRLGGLLGGA